MTRERSTWNIHNIAKQAGLKVADPYLMNQDHVRQQPAADEYVIGGPSEFAEDVHPSAGTWESEYSGGQVKRNEIGMPEMRGDTFNHPEKTASREVLTKKAALCVAISRAILPKTASDTDVEEQSISFMHLPDTEVMSTYTRLAQQEDQSQQDQDQGQKQAQDQQAQGQQDQEKQAGKIPPQFLENVKKKQEEAKDGDKEDSQGKQAQDQQQGQQDQDQGQKQAQDQQQAQEQDKQAGMQQQLAQLIQQAQQQLQQLQAGQQQQQQVGQQQQQAGQQQQSAAQQVAQAVQQAVAQGQDPVEACAKAMAQGQQIQQQGNDGELIDQMLAQQTQQAPVANMDIELDTPTMDVGEVQLGPEDDMLRSLFANDETQQAEQAQEGGQQKQAHAVRTASTRTVGTIPTQGVSRIGGGLTASSTNSNDKLASIWSSAPDVREAFGIPTNH